MPILENYIPEEINPSMRKYLNVPERAEAQDAGTAEGAKKGWEKRRHGGTGIEIQNPAHEFMFKLYDEYQKPSYEYNPDSHIYFKGPRSEFESSSPRIMFERAYRHMHGKPIRRDWQDHLNEVLSEKAPEDLPTPEQLDDIVERYSMHPTAAERSRDGIGSNVDTVVAARLEGIFPHYREADKKYYGEGGYGASTEKRRREFISRLRGRVSEHDRKNHPVMKFLDKAYPLGDATPHPDDELPSG